MALVSKLKENILNGFYVTHPKGKDLLDMDLQETLDHRCDSLVNGLEIKIKELELDILDLKEQAKLED